jgi:hypothetical protein
MLPVHDSRLRHNAHLEPQARFTHLDASGERTAIQIDYGAMTITGHIRKKFNDCGELGIKRGLTQPVFMNQHGLQWSPLRTVEPGAVAAPKDFA